MAKYCMRSRLGWLAVCSALVACSEGSPGEGIAASGPGEFEFVRFESGGEACADCSRAFEVRGDRTLRLTDSHGVESFDLLPEESDPVFAIVTAPDFRNMLLQGADCPSVVGGADSVVASWSKVGPIADTNITGCLGARGDPHPYGRLYWMLIDYKNKYLGCEIRESQPLWNPQNGPPPIRMLCWPCKGAC